MNLAVCGIGSEALAKSHGVIRQRPRPEPIAQQGIGDRSVNEDTRMHRVFALQVICGIQARSESDWQCSARASSRLGFSIAP